MIPSGDVKVLVLVSVVLGTLRDNASVTFFNIKEKYSRSDRHCDGGQQDYQEMNA